MTIIAYAVEHITELSKTVIFYSNKKKYFQHLSNKHQMGE